VQDRAQGRELGLMAHQAQPAQAQPPEVQD